MKALRLPQAASYPLARRMMVVVILWSGLFTLFTTAAQVYLDYRREMSLLEARLQQIQVIEAPSLANSAWHFDDKQIDTQLQGMLNLQDIGYLALQVTGGDSHIVGHNIPADAAISKTFELEYRQNGETFAVGQLLVMADIRSLRQRVLGRLFEILLAAAFQIFLLAGLILFIVERILTHPLNEIARYAESLHLEHLEDPLVLPRRKFVRSLGDELDLVALKLNEMRCRLMEDVTERQQTENLLLAQNQTLIAQQQALEEAEAHTRQLNAELEKRVADRTDQLAALNQELESFSYSVAHDLRAPLRHMDGFSQIILESHGGELSDEVKSRLQRIRESSQNLAQMVDALLALSRVSRDEPYCSQVDLSLLAQVIVDDLQQCEPGRQATVNIAPDLVVWADKRLLRIVLENLLGNAWKFTAQRSPAQIEVGRLTPSPGEPAAEPGTTYYVRDNGAGFDMAYAGRLFGPFQRLHSAAEFPGTGIGLATVKRIIQRHGGRVWAESAPEQGATFYFTLP